MDAVPQMPQLAVATVRRSRTEADLDLPDGLGVGHVIVVTLGDQEALAILTGREPGDAMGDGEREYESDHDVNARAPRHASQARPSA